jgi:hypothetical protein
MSSSIQAISASFLIAHPSHELHLKTARDYRDSKSERVAEELPDIDSSPRFNYCHR